MSSHDKVAVVTGTGIGKAAAPALLKDGYRVALAGRKYAIARRHIDIGNALSGTGN